MSSASRLNAARRTLTSFYRQRMRYVGRNLSLPSGLADISLITLAGGAIRLSGRATQPLRLVSDQAMIKVAPKADGRFEAQLNGTRYLSIFGISGHRDPACTLSLSRPSGHVMAILRCLGELIPFPLVHFHDLRAYFLKGDSEAGNRLERALVPSLAPANAIPIPQGTLGPVAARAAQPPDAAPQDPGILPPVIILPVYNAAPLVRECLDHLGRNTRGPHQILIIDDASPDPQIAPMLADWVSRHPQARLLTNERNAGFVVTVNRGLALAHGHDVVLLNSDAMVPPGWLDRLLAPLRADPLIASVTPMSNDAEIFNAPVECRARVLAPGEAEAADRMAACLDPLTVLADAPTGVGFCMAMAHDWLDQVPQLDLAFGRGYGEEVDWCRRTAALGARHVGTGALFVEHRSGSSFGDEKSARVQANNKIISHRYPSYDLSVRQFRDEDPLAGPRIAVGLALLAGGAAAKGEAAFPVWLAHRWSGGAEHWLRDKIALRTAQGSGALVLRDASEEPDAALDAMLVELHAPEGITHAILSGEDVANMLAALPGGLEIGYSCLVGARAPLDFMEAITAILDRRANRQDHLSVLFHDFLPICPSYTLMGSDRRYCALPGPARCQSCYGALPVTSGRRPPTIAEWRARWHEVLLRADTIRVFSQDSHDHVSRVWPDLADRLTVAPHRVAHLPGRVAPGNSGTLTVGVLGAIGFNKGAEVLRDLAARAGREMRLVIIGRIDPAYAHPQMLIHGEYERDQIAALARDYALDCWLMPSIWPETFSYAVKECLATGLPVVGFDLGAQGESLRAAENGIVVPPDTDLTPALLAGLLSGPGSGARTGAATGARPGTVPA